MTKRLVFSLVTVLAATARADDGPPADAMALFDQGIKDMDGGNLDVACKELAASLAKYSDSGTKGALATCYTKLGKVASAWKLWRDLADTAPSPDMKKDAAGNAYQLEARLPHFVIRLKGAPTPGLKVTAGDSDVADPTLAVPLPIDPGSFTVLATAPDYVEWTQELTAAEGKTTTVEIPALVARPKPKPAPPVAGTAGGTTVIMRDDSVATRHSRHVIGLSIGIIGVAGLAVGSVFGEVASSQWNTAQKDCNNMVNMCPSSAAMKAEGQIQSAKTSALVSTLGISIGGVAAVTGAIIFASAPSVEQRPATAWRMLPTVSPSVAGLTLVRGW